MPDYSQVNLLKTGSEISVYKDALTTKGIVSQVVRIKQAFPQLELGFYDILTDMVKQDKFTDNRLKDAVDHVIRTCVYPQPTIAQFLSFDKKVKVYPYQECINIAMEVNCKITDLFIKTENGFIKK